MLALGFFVLMLLAFLLVGGLAARRVKGGSETDLIVAGRSLPLWIALLTMTATWVDGGYLLGTAEGAFKSNLALGAQGGLCFGASLILGGLFFARRMRRLGFTTLIDPFEARFGKGWAAVLFIPAMLAEVFWSAELLVAIGSSFDVLLGIRLTWAILLAAAAVTAYTMLGGLWSVAYTDVVQLALVALGLLVALPFLLNSVGGLHTAYVSYSTAHAGSHWSTAETVNWWDVAAMLTLGGIPWNCYFQRVLSCKTPSHARQMSVWSGLLTMGFMVPPLLVGMAAFSYKWPAAIAARLAEYPSETLPMFLRQATPVWVGLLGLAAIVGAVTSSFSSSILSAASMFSWNCCKRLLRPSLSHRQMKTTIRVSVAVLGGGALLMALKVQSVQALWFFTSDLVFVLLFPQLVYALFDPKANRTGSIAAFAIALVIRIGGGEPLLGIPPLIPYPEIFAGLLPGTPKDWYDASTGAMLFPFKTLAAAAGLIVLPVVSRLTVRVDAPRLLVNLQEAEVGI